MKITIEATDQLTTINGLPVRVWRGETEDGVPCTVMVHRIEVRDDEDCTRFEQELIEKLPPGRLFPLRLVLP